jgi:dTDP-glucose 4,6-dehydratase
LKLQGGGLSKRSFLYIDDVSKATEIVINRGKIGDIYHISSRNYITIASLVESICKCMDFAYEEAIEIVGDRIGKDNGYNLDDSKIRNELKWDDVIPLQEGIKMVIKWINEYWIDIKEECCEYKYK